MDYAIQFRTTQFFRIKTKYPINNEFVTLKTLKIRLKMANSRRSVVKIIKRKASTVSDALKFCCEKLPNPI